MTTCVVVNSFTMGVNPRQCYHEQEGRAMNGELKDLKQLPDSSYWCSVPTRVHPSAAERISRSALRALLQQPPPLSLVPDTHSESDALDNGVIMQPSWPQYQDQGGFRNPKGHPPSIQQPQQHNVFQSSGHQQVEHQAFDLQQQPTSNEYHVNYNRSGGRQQLPVAGSLSSSREQSELGQLHQRQVLQREGITRHDLPAVPPRMGSSLPKEFEKMQMMVAAQQQMNKIRFERRRSFDQDRQLSSPECAGGSKLKFGITADGIRNGPDTHPTLHSQHQSQPQQQQRQQQQPQTQQHLFSRGFLSTINQSHNQDLNTSGSPRSTFSTETRTHIEDAEVMKQFQERILQLDTDTRRNLQESLYRLARSARERQEEMRASSRASAEPDYHAAMMDMMDMDSCTDRSASVPQSRVKVESKTNAADRTLMAMMFTPLRLPDLQNPSDPLLPSCTTARHVPAGRTPGNWNWSTGASSKGNNNNWGCPPGDPPDSSNMVHAQFHVRDGGAARHLGGGNRSTGTQPVDIRTPRRCDSQSSITSDQSYSSSHGGQVLQHFGNGGFQGPSSYGSQEAGSFASDGHHMELAGAGSQAAVEHQHPTNQNFTMMNMNVDILSATLSVQSRTAQDHMDRFQPPPQPPIPSSASYNSNAKNVTVGFPPLRYEDGFHFDSECRGRNRGTVGSIFDQKSASVLRNMVDTGSFMLRSEYFPS